MTAGAWFAVAILVVGGVGVLILVRYVARRETSARPVLVSGDVPPAPQWLPQVLRESAPTPVDHWSWSAVEESGVLSGFRGEVRLPGEEVVIQTALQPHTHQATYNASRPLRVMVDLVEFPRRPALSRLLLGPYPARSALDLRALLQRRIRDGARSVGAQARVPRPLRATTVAAIGGLVILLALVGLGATYPAGWGGEPRPGTTTRPPSAAPPASATRCPAPTKATGAPTRSASGNKATGCALAETVRRAYVKRAPAGRTVTLANVARPKSKKKYDFRCSGKTLVTCSSGKLVVYLF